MGISTNAGWIFSLRGLNGLSLVDAVSFVAARARWIVDAFAYHRDFEGAGFRLVG